MRKLTYFVAATIDGFVAGPSGDDPTGEDGFFLMTGDHMDAIFADYPDIIPGHVRQALGIDTANKVFDTVLEGRRSYEIGLKAGIPDAYPHLRHIVFSSSIKESPAPAVEIVPTDPIEKVRELKQEDGKRIWLCGGGKLAAALRPEIDELILKLHPVTIGTGIRLFEGDFRPDRFDLTETHVYDSGVMFLTYTKR